MRSSMEGVLRQWKLRPPVLTVANFPLTVVGGRIVCPRARGWVKPRLFPPAQPPLPEQDRSGWLV